VTGVDTMQQKENRRIATEKETKSGMNPMHLAPVKQLKNSGRGLLKK
jgi:hypothetical protein